MKEKLLYAAAALLLAACTSVNAPEEVAADVEDVADGDLVQVRLALSGFDVSVTRAAVADVCTRLDVWLYESGAEVHAAHQVSTDEGFGGLDMTLNRTKTYTLYAVAHKGSAAASLADGIISFPEDKVTHTFYIRRTFQPTDGMELALTMARIVAQLKLETVDAVPAEITTMRFTLSDVFDRWSVTDGAVHQVDRVVTFEGFSRKQDGTAAFTIYTLVDDDAPAHAVTVEALDEGGNVVQTKELSVPLLTNRRTLASGNFFTDAASSLGFSLNTDWGEDAVVEF